ncbi:hypothetical protein PH552_32075 [Rhizobium sp. CNPSo 3968]|uniref:hypothetical protein n=1 Tax=Rhizobium sp. CNPSo 3968 TaxID=3021408 RepID=UPI00254B88F8|nr:hypothetical protein [Rhizobium sp. CNPSo 3968]MDK4723996.1 hypothetical protein [Rhizobium sp. CNPSo 3968]
MAERAASFAPMRDEIAQNIFGRSKNDPQVAIIGPAEMKNRAKRHAMRQTSIARVSVNWTAALCCHETVIMVNKCLRF